MTNNIASLIHIDVKPYYIEERQMEQESIYIFGYQITIKNNSNHPVQLLSRHWVITDGNGDQDEVKGEGVIGQQPTIEPNNEFQYNSGSNFKTPVGTMHGQYEMVSRNDTPEYFSVEISPFLLADKKILQ